MGFLIAEILILLALATALGAWLGHVWTRRRFTDVTSEYTTFDSTMDYHKQLALTADQGRLEAERHAATLAGERKGLLAQIDDLGNSKAIDLEPTNHRLMAIEKLITAMKPTDVQSLLNKIADIEKAVQAIRIPEFKLADPPKVDLAPLNAKLTEIDKAIHAISFPEQQHVDLAPLNAKILDLDKAVHAINFPANEQVDLQPLYVRFADIERQITAIRIPAPSVLDLSPVLARFGDIEQNMKALSKTEGVDFASLLQRLDQLEEAFKSNSKYWPQQVADTDKGIEHIEHAFVAVTDYSKHIRPDGGKNLLTGPVYGQPDDLKRIVGVAGVLEKMMHHIGVYYFWQVAEWTEQDIVFVDSKLTAFRGRIKRDNWLKQCRKFAREPTAARPDNHDHTVSP